jgi:hypothetical protein
MPKPGLTEPVPLPPPEQPTSFPVPSASMIAIEPSLSDSSTHHALDQGSWERKWQEKLLPLMMITIGLCFVFFLVASTLQFSQLRVFAEAPYLSTSPDDDSALDSLIADTKLDAAKTELIKWKTLVRLERQAWRYRYQAAASLSAFRIWTRYTAFVTGMILVCVGSVFILGKLRENESRVNSESVSWKVSVATSSPGILLSVFGVGLMLATLVTEHRMDMQDQAIYILPTVSQAGAAAIQPSPPDFPKHKGTDEK